MINVVSIVGLDRNRFERIVSIDDDPFPHKKLLNEFLHANIHLVDTIIERPIVIAIAILGLENHQNGLDLKGQRCQKIVSLLIVGDGFGRVIGEDKFPNESTDDSSHDAVPDKLFVAQAPLGDESPSKEAGREGCTEDNSGIHCISVHDSDMCDV